MAFFRTQCIRFVETMSAVRVICRKYTAGHQHAASDMSGGLKDGKEAGAVRTH